MADNGSADGLGVTIGAREIYDTLVGLREDVQNLTSNNESAGKILNDHESRIRGLERWKYGIPVTLITGIVAAVAAWK